MTSAMHARPEAACVCMQIWDVPYERRYASYSVCVYVCARDGVGPANSPVGSGACRRAPRGRAHYGIGAPIASVRNSSRSCDCRATYAWRVDEREICSLV